ncbi:hypothetical protein KFU94_67825 [Chloroflexi bacterium TSY]|nr:hypothetical protein [Chloroflexi bacterium TSY]
MPHDVELSARAKRSFAKLGDTLKRDIIAEIKAMRSEGIPDYAERLERELDTRWKIRLNGWRIILTPNNGKILILDIRRRDSRTYLNVP